MTVFRDRNLQQFSEKDILLMAQVAEVYIGEEQSLFDFHAYDLNMHRIVLCHRNHVPHSEQSKEQFLTVALMIETRIQRNKVVYRSILSVSIKNMRPLYFHVKDRSESGRRKWRRATDIFR